MLILKYHVSQYDMSHRDYCLIDYACDVLYTYICIYMLISTLQILIEMVQPHIQVVGPTHFIYGHEF